MDNNGWETYSKLVLKQLETLAGGIDSLRTELQLVQTQLTELKAKEDKVQDLKVWKEKMDEVSSPIFMVIQSVMGFAIAWALDFF
jgi:TolA-binding protein